MGVLNRGILGKGLTPEEAKQKASKVYEQTTGKKIGGPTLKDRVAAYVFFGAIILLAMSYLLKRIFP